MIDENTLEIMKYQKLKGNLIAIKSLIKIQKENLLKNINKAEIISCLKYHCVNAQETMILLNMYYQMFKVDLLEELKDTHNKEKDLQEYLEIFIRFKIIQNHFPYNYVLSESPILEE